MGNDLTRFWHAVLCWELEPKDCFPVLFRTSFQKDALVADVWVA